MLSGLISGDESHVEATATSVTFDDPEGDLRAKDVGTNKTITASGLDLATPSGKTASVKNNYELGGVSSVQTAADITQRPLTITPSPANTVSDDSTRYEKIYDGLAAAEYDAGSGTAEMVSCAVNSLFGDTVTADCTDATFANENVARNIDEEVIDKSIIVSNISLSGSDALNYSLSSTTLTLTDAAIIPKPLLASGFEANDKPYDGERSATFSISGASLTGFVGSDNFAFDSLTGVFFSRDVAVSSGEVVDQDVRLTSWRFNGADDVTNNYTIDIDNSITQAKITPINLPVSLSVTPRTYDGTTNATITATIDPGDLIDRDDPKDDGDTFVEASATGNFPTKNAGSQTLENVTVTLSGGDAGDRSDNYVPTFSTPSGTISKRTLTWTLTASDKVYDGSSDAGLTLGDIADNRVSGDDFTVSFSSATFSSAAVGTGKTVTMSGLSISGTDAANYSYATTATDTANITARTISVTGTFTADEKVYDRNRTATVGDTSNLSLSNIVAADQELISVGTTSARFDSRMADTGKTVELLSLTVTGPNSANYSVDVSGVTDYTDGVITPKPLGATVNVADRQWDGTTDATITSITLTGIVSGDTVSVDEANAVAVFRDPDQGDDKPVDVTNIRFVESGAWQNYSLDLTETSSGVYSATTTATISGSPLTVTITASDKVYDGTTAASVTVVFTAADDSEVTPTYTGGSATFAQADVGTNLLVTASGFELTGEDAEEFVLTSSTATDRADITAAALSIAATDKVYDGTDEATVSLAGVIGSDDVGFAAAPAATFDDPGGTPVGKDVGTNKAVTATGISLTGSDSGNYSINGTETTTASITQRLLTPTFTPNPVVNSPASPVTVDVVDDRITGDVLTVDYTRAESVRRGNQLVLIVSELSLSGTDAGNYRVLTPYELVLRTFANPSRNMNNEASPPAEPVPSPLVTPWATVRPAIPEAQGLERPTRPSQAPNRPTAPPASSEPAPAPEPTVDLGAGVVSLVPGERADSGRSNAVRTPSQLAQDRLGGFLPNAPITIEVRGAKTAVRFFTDAEVLNQPALLLEQLSLTAQGQAESETDRFFSISDLTIRDETSQEIDSLPQAEEEIKELFADSGLPAPKYLTRQLSDLLSSQGWLSVRADIRDYKPGSVVYLVANSEPLIVGYATVDDRGQAVLEGDIPVSWFGVGEHRIRAVGIRSFDGIGVDDRGEIVIPEPVIADIQRFDLGTQATLLATGPNPNGGQHLAVRIVPLEPQAPWWTLWIIFGSFVLMFIARLRGVLATRTQALVGAFAVLMGAIPGVVLGWVSTVTVVTGWAAALGVLGALLVRALPRMKRESRRS